MRAIDQVPIRFCGEVVSDEDLSTIKQVIDRFPHLSRTELANTLCELLNWYRPDRGLKTVECRQFLEILDAQSLLWLPPRREAGRPHGSQTRVARTARGASGESLVGVRSDYPSVSANLSRDR